MKPEKLQEPNFDASESPPGWGRHVLFVVALTAVISGVLVAAASGGVAAADPADIEISRTSDATDVNESGPLPDKYFPAAYVEVRNTTGGVLYQMDVSFTASNGAQVNKRGTRPSSIKGTIPASDIPDDGEISVDVSVDGTNIGTVNLSKEPIKTDKVKINKSLSTDVQSVTVKIDGSEVDKGDYRTFAAPKNVASYGNFSVDMVSKTGLLPINVLIDNSTTATKTKTLERSEIPPYQEDALNATFNSTQTPTNTTLYFPKSVEMIQVDGTTVYDQGPLGGGIGGSSSQTMILVVIAGAAAIVLLQNN